MKEKTRKILQWILEISTLILFIALTYTHKLQLWFGIFMAGALVSFFIGRYYCGWICPMHTLFRPVAWVYKRLRIKRLKTPEILSSKWLRYIVLFLFLAAMVMMQILQIRINLLLYIVLFSVLITLFFDETFWHRQLCPFGTILSLTSRKAKISMRIEEAGCINCGACQKECPGGSIITKEDNKRFNQKWECLLCYRCLSACPTHVCKIGKYKEEKS